MTKIMMYVLEFIATFVVVIAIGAALPGQASDETNLMTLAQGEVSGGYQVSAHLKLSERDPSRVGEVGLVVAHPNTSATPKNVRISLDNGLTWNSCTQMGDQEWTCWFNPDQAPKVKNIYYVNVVVS